VVNNDNILTLQVGESTYIPTKTKHRLSNKSQESKLIIIEVQTGNYLGEDDIIRFEDVYGRVSNI
jgi:mannose-6-phosphate isomerase-like protein (cupin superfamily)